MPVPLSLKSPRSAEAGSDRFVLIGDPRRAVVGRHLDEEVVEVRLGVVPEVGGQRCSGRDLERLRRGVAEVVAAARPVRVGSGLRRRDHVVARLVRQERDQRLGLLRSGVVRPDLVLGLLAVLRDLVVLALRVVGAAEPAELELLPRAHVGRRVADPVRATVADVRARRHQRPERRVVLGAARVPGRVVEVGQTEVVAELVREDAEAAVLRLHRVVADPDARRVVRDQRARDEPAAGADVDPCDPAGAAGLEVRERPVAPDRVRALLRIARGLVAAGVDDLEVVDEAVRLVEVAVPVDVVAVLLVERLQVRDDLRHLLPGVELLLHPHGKGVAHERARRRADDAAAVVAAVERLVERHLHPRRHVARNAVAVGRLPLVVRGHPVEVHVLVVRLAVVGLPERRVVDGAVRLRDAVPQRPVEHLRVRERLPGRVLGVVGEQRVRIPLVAELDQDHEDPVLARALELDVLPVRDAVHLPVRLALQLGLEALLERGVVALRLGAAEVVSRPLREARGTGDAVDPGPGTGRGRERAQRHHERAQGAQQILQLDPPSGY